MTRRWWRRRRSSRSSPSSAAAGSAARREVAQFETREQLVASTFKEELAGFVKKKSWITKHSENEVWRCKYEAKAGYKCCARKIKLEFAITSQAVTVLDNMARHKHEADPEYVTAGKKYL